MRHPYFNQLVLSSLTMLLLSLPMGSSRADTGTTYYVSTNGSDSNTGTSVQPLKTIQAAVNKISSGSGGAIYVRGGTYTNLSIWVGEQHDGSANSHLVIRPNRNEKVILDGISQSGTCISVGGQYVDIIGFECRHTDQGIVGWRAHNLRVLNNTVHDTNANGIAIYGDKVGATSDIVVDSNTVYHTNLNNQARDPNRGGWGNGIFISRGKNAVVTHNRVYENYGEGIISSLSDNVLAAYNTVYDNYNVEMYMDNATNTVFENNLIYNTGNHNFDHRIWGAASGIQMANENYDPESNPLNNNTAQNNIVIGGRVGITYGSYFKGGGLKNTKIINNTFYITTGALVDIAADRHENTTFANNIFYKADDDGKPLAYLPSNLAGLNFNHNLWSGGPGTAAGLGDVNADPQFIKPGGLTATDYKLQKRSPAINAGVTLREVSQDYFGNPRPINRAYDIGAYEFGGTK